MFSKFLLSLCLTLVSSAVLAPSPYPIKSFKPAAKEAIASYDAKVKEMTAKPSVVTPLKSYKQSLSTQKVAKLDDPIVDELYQLTFTPN